MAYPERPAEGSVLHWREGAIAQLRLNRPQALNAVDIAMTQALRAAAEQIADDPAVRVLVISGAGRAFQAGGDVAAMAADPVNAGRGLIDAMHGTIRALNRLRCPVIAQVQGAAAGAAIGLLSACDLVIAADDARFSLAFPALGASADSSSTWGLPRLMGLRRALRFALLGESLSAAQALEQGLVSEVVPAAELAATVERHAAAIAQMAPLALAEIRQLLRQSLDHTLDQQLDAEAEAFLRCAASADFAEGTAAFLARRRPQFQGR